MARVKPVRPAAQASPRSGTGTELASRLVDEAGRILSADGASALTLRRLAQASGTSTMAVYTLFGDKQGLLGAMYREGFRRLGTALEEVTRPVTDPLTALAALGVTYRRTALANPHLYDLMFGRPVPSFVPDAGTLAVADAAYQPLVQAVRRCLDAGQLSGGTAERIALHLWAVTHGMVGLELAGHLPGEPTEREAAYAEALAFSSAPFLPSLSDR